MRLILARTWLASLLLSAPAITCAHHSLSGQFDVTRTFEITGVVSRVDWINPHTYIYVDVKQPDGDVLEYKLESLPVGMMRKAGVSRQDLQGDGHPVHIKAHPARNNIATLGYLLVIKLKDGREIQFARVPGAEDPAGAKP